MKLLFPKTLTLLVSILIFINTLIISTLFVLNFKYLYYFDINYLNIKNSSGFTEEKIRENYDYAIKYVTDSSLEEFSPPSLKASIDGKNHFKDVQNIFSNLKKLVGPSIIMMVLGIFILKKFNYPKKFLKFSSNFLIGLPILLILTFTIDFNLIFTLFHKVSFSSNNWLFDPRYDEIIKILPEEFFMHCASLILAISFIVGIILMVFYKFKKGYKS